MRDSRRERSIGTVWPARERLLVAVAGRAGDDALVRQVARMARRLDADWMVVYVDAPQRQHRPRSVQAAVLKTLALAARLGAETATLPGADVAEALVAFARERNARSEEHTSELQSQSNLVCRLLLEKKKQTKKNI